MNKKQTAFIKAIEKNSNSAAVRKLNSEVSNLGQRRLTSTLQLAKLVSDGIDWFNSPETKAKLKELELKITAEEFIQQQYGFQKSFAYKLKRAAELPAELVEEYLSSDFEECSLNSLLSFAKAKEEKAVNELEGGETDAEGGGESETASEGKSPVWISLVVTDTEGQKSSVRLRYDGSIETKGDIVNVAEAIAKLSAELGVEVA